VEGSWQSCVGTEPVRDVFARYKVVSLVSKPNSVGIAEPKVLYPMLSDVRSVRSPKVVGILPVNLLDRKLAYWILVNKPSWLGMELWKLL